MPLPQNDSVSLKMKPYITHFEIKKITQTNPEAFIIFSEKIENIKKNFTIT
ncbi:hypothetical protein GCM10027442_04400 [Emticicia fontis]